jgi:hypothetical protein
MSSATMPTTSTTPPTSAARREVLAWIADEVGARRMWKLTIFSTLGLLLVVGLLGMLVSIYLSGSASLDDIGVPIGVVALLLPIVGIGAVRGALGVRALRSHPLLVALEAPARVYHCSLVRDGTWNGVRLVLESGDTYTLWAPNRAWAPFVVATLSER